MNGGAAKRMELGREEEDKKEDLVDFFFRRRRLSMGVGGRFSGR